MDFRYRVFLCAFIGIFSNCTAITITTLDGVGADAHIEELYPNLNQGQNANLNIKGAPGFVRKSYFRFDLNSVGDITAAEFQVSFLNHIGPFTGSIPINIFGLNDDQTGQDWDESGITWNNAPANAGGIGLTSSATTFLGSTSVYQGLAEDTLISFTSADLIQFLNDDTDGLVTLMIAPASGSSSLGGFRLNSKEYAVLKGNEALAPTLNLTASSVPEGWPTGSSLFLLGSLFLGLFSIQRFKFIGIGQGNTK